MSQQTNAIKNSDGWDNGTKVAGQWGVQFTFEVHPIGQDSEWADVSNPRGYIYGDVWFVQVSSEYGHRFRHAHSFVNDPEGAKRLAERVVAKLMDDPHWTPNPMFWTQDRNVYGSQAYIDEDSEAYWAEMERQHDLETEGMYV